MLADAADLDAYALAPSNEAMSEVADETVCALCDAPHLDTSASLQATLDWLDAYLPEEAGRMRESLIAENEDLRDQPGGRSSADPDPPIRWKSTLRRVSVDSVLSPRYAIPIAVLDIVASRLDPTLNEFVPDAFLAMICDRCATTPSRPEHAVSLLLRTFVRRHGFSNENVARRQPAWPLVERFLGIVDDALRGRRYGT